MVEPPFKRVKFTFQSTIPFFNTFSIFPFDSSKWLSNRNKYSFTQRSLAIEMQSGGQPIGWNFLYTKIFSHGMH